MYLQQGLFANQLKLIAIIAMTIDHLAWTLYPGYSTHWYVLLFHIIGRLTAPIMWFFIAEGYHHTRNIQKYAVRLFVLTLVSHFAYNFCFNIPFLPFQTSAFNQTSVAWGLMWGLLLLYINDSERLKLRHKIGLTILVCIITFPADWSCISPMAILFIGANRGDFKKQMLWMTACSFAHAIVYFLFIDRLYAIVQLFTCLSIPLLRRYNGQRGARQGLGKIFYLYYPAHLALCGVIRVLI